MITETDLANLKKIKSQYGKILEVAGEAYQVQPEILAGIMMRESKGGEALDQNGRGDSGHGHGLMQIDDRSFPLFCSQCDWRNPAVNILFAAFVLSRKKSFIQRKFNLDEQGLIRAAIAAYNCGEGNVQKALLAGEDIDSRTSRQNYSRVVLEYAEAYNQLA